MEMLRFMGEVVVEGLKIARIPINITFAIELLFFGMLLVFCAENVREKSQWVFIKLGINLIVSELFVGIMIFLNNKIEVDKFSTKTVNTGKGIFDIILLVWVIYLMFELWDKWDRKTEETAKTKR